MNREEREKLFRLLACLYPRATQLKSEETRTAWGLALEPYQYEEVRAAALEHARRSPYFPAISDLTKGLVGEQDHGPKPWMLPYIEQGAREREERKRRKASMEKEETA